MELHIEDIVKALPEIVKYFIPGYICLRLKEIFGFQRNHSKFATIIMSLLYSFIVLGIFTLSKNIVKGISVDFYNKIFYLGNEEDRQIIKCVFFVILGCSLGLALSRLQRTKLARYSARKINRLYTPAETPWVRIISLPYGLFVNISMKNGKQYSGNLVSATGDPDDPHKEILLRDYENPKNSGQDNNTNSKFEQIKDKLKEKHKLFYYDNELPIVRSPLILLKYEDIEAIEVIPVSRKLHEDDEKRKKEEKKKAKIEKKEKEEPAKPPVKLSTGGDAITNPPTESSTGGDAITNPPAELSTGGDAITNPPTESSTGNDASSGPLAESSTETPNE